MPKGSFHFESYSYLLKLKKKNFQAIKTFYLKNALY